MVYFAKTGGDFDILHDSCIFTAKFCMVTHTYFDKKTSPANKRGTLCAFCTLLFKAGFDYRKVFDGYLSVLVDVRNRTEE